MKPERCNSYHSPPPPRKRLGQHFLIDKNIVKKIIHLADLQPEETVLEIGPGRGILTAALCQKVSKVIAIEVDSRLSCYLSEIFGQTSNLEVKHGDALKFPYRTLPQGTVVVANLPYNISTPLLFQFLEARTRIKRMVLTLQYEVARRLVAQPGTREYGVLSVLIQYFADTRLAFQVSQSCFRPSPEVASAVVLFDMKSGCPFEAGEIDLFVRVVRAAFGHRRKILFNAMRDAGFSPATIESACERAKIDRRRRAETLTIPEFEILARAFREFRPQQNQFPI